MTYCVLSNFGMKKCVNYQIQKKRHQGAAVKICICSLPYLYKARVSHGDLVPDLIFL